ncbi:hypothetical protein BU15DRAFT_63483, partial [Melanogaster broomeanus]
MLSDRITSAFYSLLGIVAAAFVNRGVGQDHKRGTGIAFEKFSGDIQPLRELQVRTPDGPGRRGRITGAAKTFRFRTVQVVVEGLERLAYARCRKLGAGESKNSLATDHATPRNDGARLRSRDRTTDSTFLFRSTMSSHHFVQQVLIEVEVASLTQLEANIVPHDDMGHRGFELVHGKEPTGATNKEWW